MNRNWFCALLATESAALHHASSAPITSLLPHEGLRTFYNRLKTELFCSHIPRLTAKSLLFLRGSLTHTHTHTQRQPATHAAHTAASMVFACLIFQLGGARARGRARFAPNVRACRTRALRREIKHIAIRCALDLPHHEQEAFPLGEGK